MEDRLAVCVRFLEGVSADRLGHSDRSLLAHLLGTRSLLEGWGARQPLCDAGLFHSAYSTEAYPAAAVPVSRRAEVQALVGPAAEHIAWVFCVMERESFDHNLGRVDDLWVVNRLTSERLDLDRQTFLDLVNLSCANTLEAIPRLPWLRRRACHAYLARYDAVAMSAASAAVGQARGSWWQVWR